MKGMMLHCGGEYVSLREVQQVPVPPRTPSWNPMPYGESIGLVREMATGLTKREIIGEEYGLNRDGKQMFALIKLGPQPGDSAEMGPCVALRGSYDKSLSNALAGGADVFVCDNLSIMGSAVKIMRKNTTFVHRDWREMVARAMRELTGHYLEVAARAEKMKQLECSLRRGFALIGVALGERVINSSQANVAFAEWRRPTHEVFAQRNLWSFYNALTEGAKKGTAGDTIDRHVRVDRFIDVVAEPKCKPATAATVQ